MARYNVDLQDNEGNAYQIMANPDSVAEFSPAVNRENIRSGETYRVIFGKIMKYLSVWEMLPMLGWQITAQRQ